MESIRILSRLLLLCTFSELTLALPPFRSDLGPADLEIHGTKNSVNPLYRLPKAIVPISYNLEIKPILDDFQDGTRFTNPGKVTILVECKEATDTIVLHTVNTTIGVLNVTALPEGTLIPTVGDLQFNLTSQTVTVKLGAQLVVAKNYEIYIEFVSPVAQNRVDGLYLSSYIDPATKETKYLCATDLEADDARRIFPLFDEPAMKANWTVSILRTAKYHTLANHEKLDGPPVEVEPGWFRDSYKEVIPMSSYLFAVAVSDFTNHTADSSLFGGKPVTIWGPPPILAEGGGVYSANLSALLLEFFEEFFDSEYPLPKMDKISLPDFNSGAMENYGLNTYREGRLLFLEGISTIEDKVRMTNTISHELAHQWFGNLVTMEWWNDLWLNEGFATYMAALGVEQVFPEYAPIESLLVNSIQPAMQMDVSASAHPISPDPEDVINETDISGLFSTIVYHKGASIIRMTNAFLRDDNMIIGLRKYLKDFEYGNAVQDDLFNVLNEVAVGTTLPDDITVNQVLNTWTKQSGFPVVRVTRAADKITFMQEKFDNPTDITSMWWIPITYVLQGYMDDPEVPIDTSTKLWLGTMSGEHLVTIPATSWILVNPTQIGNYRVIYDEMNYNALVAQLNTDTTAIDVMSKSAILDDYFNIAFSGKYRSSVRITHALDLTGFLSKEHHFVPWITFLTNLERSYRMLGRSSTFLYYRSYLLNLIKPVLTEIKMDEQENDTPGGQIMLRTRLVEWACNLGETECVKFAREQFTNWMGEEEPAVNNRVNPDLRTTLYCTAVANGGDAEWDFVIARYGDANEATSSRSLPEVARNSLVRALGCAKQSYRLAKLLDIALDPQSFLLPEHRLTAIQAVAGNSAGVDLTFNFLRNNFDTLVRRFGVGLFTSSVSTLSNYLNTELDKKDLQAFVDSREELLPYKASIDASIANIQRNIEWLGLHSSELRTWLIAHSGIIQN